MERQTQAQQIKQYLESGGKLTALSALEKFGCMRLAARINDLRKDKLPINSRTITKGDKRYAEYFIKPDLNNN